MYIHGHDQFTRNALGELYEKRNGFQIRPIALPAGAGRRGRRRSGAAASGRTGPGPTASAGDPQEQAREMIVGRPVATTAATKLGASRDAGAAADRKIEGDPLEMARQMILGRHSTADLPKARLAGKAR